MFHAYYLVTLLHKSGIHGESCKHIKGKHYGVS